MSNVDSVRDLPKWVKLDNYDCYQSPNDFKLKINELEKVA